jgi:hypothetical protein
MIVQENRSRLVLHKRSRERLRTVQKDLAEFSRLAGESVEGDAAREAAEWLDAFLVRCHTTAREVSKSSSVSKKDRQLPVGDR